MKLLRIDSSARKNSVSRQLTADFVKAWRTQYPDGEVFERNLATTHLPPITDEWVQAAYAAPDSLSTEQRLVLATSDALIEELRQADVMVIGAPMYNFAISAPLKAWIDQVVRVGQTVLWAASGPQGLLAGKRVYVVTSRGGAFRPGTPAESFDHQEPYLRHILAFMGLTDVTFIHAENQKPGPQGELVRAAAVVKIQEHASQVCVNAVQ